MFVFMASAVESTLPRPTVPPLVIVYQALARLIPDPRNARTHPKRQIEQIVASIRAFGFANPILVDGVGGIIAGHGRLLAAKLLCMAEVPTIVLPHLSQAQQRALRLADNKIALGAGRDVEILKLELAELAVLDVDFDLSLTGFSAGEIDVVLQGQPDPDDELIPAVPVNARTKPGDIWICGEHRIGCGEGRDAAFLEAVVGAGDRVDAAFLDPPYNVRINGHANAKGRHREFAMASGKMSDAGFMEFLTESLTAGAAVSRDGAVHFVCMDWRHIGAFEQAGKSAYDALLNICVWNKSNAGMGSLYRSKHEFVFVFIFSCTGPRSRCRGGRPTRLIPVDDHGRSQTTVEAKAPCRQTPRPERSEQWFLLPELRFRKWLAFLPGRSLLGQLGLRSGASLARPDGRRSR